MNRRSEFVVAITIAIVLCALYIWANWPEGHGVPGIGEK